MWKRRVLPLLAWVYVGLILASWWWNTKDLIAATAIVCGLILFCVATKQTWRIVLIITGVLLIARFATIPWPSTIPVLVKLALVILLWGQLGTLLTGWSLRPTLDQHPRQGDQE